MLTFEELAIGLRKKFKIKPAELSDDKLKAVWVCIDTDESGYIEMSEFHAFMGTEEDEELTPEKRAELLKKKKKGDIKNELAEKEARLEGFKSDKTTKEMRADLAAAGVAEADEEELKNISVQFAKWVKLYKPGSHQGIAWLEVFKEIDDDHSGLITFDELRMVIRRLFKVKAAEFSDNKIKVLWCALDRDDSDSIVQVEFARFAKIANTAEGGLGMGEVKLRKQFSVRNRMLGKREGGLEYEEQKAVSALLNQKLDEVIPEASLKADGFFMLFKEFDNDCSGLITFDELKRGIRMQLMIDTSLMSDIMLRQLWITLDEDDSGYVEEAELMRFMDREEPTSAIEKRQELMRLNGKAQRALYAKKVEAEIKSAKFVSSIPTATMRELVANAGLTIPEGEELKKLATDFATWTKNYLPDIHQGVAWLTVLNEICKDASGLLTYDEVRHAVRRTFKVKKAVWSEELIMALWCALDKEDKNCIQKVEFGRFVKLSPPVGTATKQFTFTDKLVEARKGGLTKEEEKEVSELLNQKVKEVMGGDDSTWFNLFKDLDVDLSGLLEFAEIKEGIRSKLNVSESELSEKKLKALWITLDEDNSGTVESAEFHRFLKREEPKDAIERRQERMRASGKRKRAVLAAQQGDHLKDEGLVSSIKTREMRAMLKKEGLKDLTDDEVRDLSIQYAKWCKEYLPDAHQGVAWLTIFKQVANDITGILTYDEIRLVIRRKFKVPNSQFSEEKIMQLWATLDYDNADAIMNADFARFMKVGEGKIPRYRTAVADDNLSRLASGGKSALTARPTKPKDTRSAVALAHAYGDDLRALLSPRKPSVRTPVIKLGTSAGDFNVPGPGSYNLNFNHKERIRAWTMGDRKARKSSVETVGDSPGPSYMLQGSVCEQVGAGKRSAPHYGFGTGPRLVADEYTASPGPGAYSPRLTRKAAPSAFQTVAVGQLTETTTPQLSTQRVQGTWSRDNETKLSIGSTDGPGCETYSPRINYTRSNMPQYTMRPLGTRQFVDPGGEVSPGPGALAPKFGRDGKGLLGDSPKWSLGQKNDKANSHRYAGKQFDRYFQGREGPPPDTYTPLEQFGVTSNTISNSSRHAPQFKFGTEVRPCAA